MGKWLKKYGETIYGTRGGPVAPKSWGVTTKKGNKVFVHILNHKNSNLLIPNFGKKIKNISTFVDGSALTYRQDDFGIIIKLPEEKIDPIDTILVLEF
jgi:alpha-L-fucosidase